jgi:GT2 family glycosyltransferase
MIKLSAVILSNTINESIFEMTKHCLATLIDSEKENRNLTIEIILVESNSQYKANGFSYSDAIKIITPKIKFNFHKFLNIGIEAASGSFIALCNNDLIFHADWFSEMLKVKETNPEIASFSPYDKTSNKLSEKLILNNDFVKGYELQRQMTGWCFVVDKEVFKKIGKLDEKFNFYYADNDYTMCLRKYNIQHALICKSFVTHLGGKVTEEVVKTNLEFNSSFDYNRKKIPKYVIKGNMYQILNDDKMIDGVIKFHQKWGHRKTIKLKLLIIEYLKRYNLGFLSKFIL